MAIHLMCDLETTGTEPGCCILSAAFYPFALPQALLGLEDDMSFYSTISHRSCKDAGLTDDAMTLAWWDKQKKEIQEEAFSGTRELKSVLDSIAYYMAGLERPDQIYVWGNGKDFDNVILTHAFKKLGVKLPWHYRNNKCYRDLADMYPQVKKKEFEGAHNALVDATMQAEHADRIVQEIKHGRAPVFPY